jgi:uncharacterized membrane protein YczE
MLEIRASNLYSCLFKGGMPMQHAIKRMFSLFLGLFLYALGIVLTMKANIGYAPWEVFHAGIAYTLGMKIGEISILVGLVIILITFFMGEKLGIATILNMLCIGIFMDALLALDLIPQRESLVFGIFQLILGLFVISLGSFFYISSGFGAGPRDSLMVALTRKTHLPIGVCRGGIEVIAVFLGWQLGGMVGFGTILSAFLIGFCIQLTFSLLHFEPTTIVHENVSETYGKLMAYYKNNGRRDVSR